MIQTLIEALEAEFDQLVSFSPTVPKQITPPAVVVSPGEPYLEPREAASSIIRERWSVVVAVSVHDPGAGLTLMRELSLRVRRASNRVGAVWQSATGPRRLADDTTANTGTVVSINEVQFRYSADLGISTS
jgi:hypothetical protein